MNITLSKYELTASHFTFKAVLNDRNFPYPLVSSEIQTGANAATDDGGANRHGALQKHIVATASGLTLVYCSIWQIMEFLSAVHAMRSKMSLAL